jgi:hypothetical protein
VSFWGAVAFIIFYTLLAPWWRNPIGQMLVSLDAGVALALAGEVLQQEFGATIPAEAVLRLTAFALWVVAVTILSRLVLLGHLHSWRMRWPWHHPRHEEGVPRPEPDS